MSCSQQEGFMSQIWTQLPLHSVTEVCSITFEVVMIVGGGGGKHLVKMGYVALFVKYDKEFR